MLWAVSPLEDYGWAGAETFILVIPSFLSLFLRTVFLPHTVLMMLLPMCSKSPHSHKHTVFSRQGCHLHSRPFSHGQMPKAAGRLHVGFMACTLLVLSTCAVSWSGKGWEGHHCNHGTHATLAPQYTLAIST